MLQQLISHNPDIARLIEEGYQVSLSEQGGHLIVRHIPYLTFELKVEYGTFVTLLHLNSPSKVGPPPDHTIYFQGKTPHNADGAALTAVINNSNKANVGGIDVDHYFSSKPASGNYPNYYEKIRTYGEILGSQAREIDPSATAKPDKQI